MSRVNSLLNERFKKADRTPKMTQLAKQSAEGQLSSFSGIFSAIDLNTHEKETLEEILIEYSHKKNNVKKDLDSLIFISSEVKAINNQAALLHGERIKKAQTILKNYREGAFTAWMIATYGNRQTPYNFLQYYEFHEAMPKKLQELIGTMPRQAIYTLASREGPLNKKQEIIVSYNGQTKRELLEMIRNIFPLALNDRRRRGIGEGTIRQLEKVSAMLERSRATVTKTQKKNICELLDTIHALVME